jgi:hypothetical protein
MNFWKNMKIRPFDEIMGTGELKFLAKYKLIIIGLVAGAIGGYLYYHFVGCTSGTCMITSRPLASTLYGAFMGALLFDMFRNSKSKSENKL